jgi:uncharacterized protein
VRVAIVGGGGAGLITAYLLHEVHDVTLLEREARLGGNIRTLGANAPAPPLDPDLRVDNGTTGFCVRTYPTYLRLLEHLGCPVRRYVGGLGAFLADGRSVHLPLTGPPDELGLQVAASLDRLARRLPCQAAGAPFQPAAEAGSCGRLFPPRFSKVALPARGTMMLAYSVPSDDVDELPEELLPLVLHTQGEPWVTIPGGTFAYVERMLARMAGRVRLERSAEVLGVTRDAAGVTVERRGASPERFDRVVFAVTPDRVLPLLRDPTDEERERFRRWEGRDFRVRAHHDEAIYARWPGAPRSTADLFELPGGRLGYNTDLGFLRGEGRRYSFAYNLALDPAKVVDDFVHRVPRYTVAALSTKAGIVRDNGARHTFHVGAYLDGGLHEGAASSAVAVSRLLGGRVV